VCTVGAYTTLVRLQMAAAAKDGERQETVLEGEEEEEEEEELAEEEIVAIEVCAAGSQMWTAGTPWSPCATMCMFVVPHNLWAIAERKILCARGCLLCF
jgi:hypothetical protein